MKFENLSEIKKSFICNGCGAKGGWVRPPHKIFFKTCCDHHDYGYWKGGYWLDKLKCDQELRKAMVLDTKKLKWYQRIRYRPWAELYFLGVVFAGNSAFNYTTKKRSVFNVDWLKVYSKYEPDSIIPWDTYMIGENV